MQIVHVVRQFHPGVGGLESVVRELAKAQLKTGHRVRVVTLDRLFSDTTQRKLLPREVIDGIETYLVEHRIARVADLVGSVDLTGTSRDAPAWSS